MNVNVLDQREPFARPPTPMEYGAEMLEGRTSSEGVDGGRGADGLTALVPKRRMVILAPVMPWEIPLRCRCRHVRGVASEVTPASGFRFVCYCKDCQTFARFLGQADILDAAGGTDIFQMPPA